MMCDVKAQQEGRRRRRARMEDGIEVMYVSGARKKRESLSLLLDRICRAFK